MDVGKPVDVAAEQPLSEQAQAPEQCGDGGLKEVPSEVVAGDEGRDMAVSEVESKMEGGSVVESERVREGDVVVNEGFALPVVTVAAENVAEVTELESEGGVVPEEGKLSLVAEVCDELAGANVGLDALESGNKDEDVNENLEEAEMEGEEAAKGDEKVEEAPISEADKVDDVVMADDNVQEGAIVDDKSKDELVEGNEVDDVPMADDKVEEDSLIVVDKSKDEPVQEIKVEEVPMADDKVEETSVLDDKSKDVPMEDDKIVEVAMADDKAEEVPMVDDKSKDESIENDEDDGVPMLGEKLEDVPKDEKAEDLPMKDDKVEDLPMVDDKSEEVLVDKDKAEDALVLEKTADALVVDEKAEEAPVVDEKVEGMPVVNDITNVVAVVGVKAEEQPVVDEKAKEAQMGDDKVEVPRKDGTAQGATTTDEKAEDSKVEKVPTTNKKTEEVHMVDEKAEKLTTEGVSEEKAGKDEKGSEMEAKQEEDKGNKCADEEAEVAEGIDHPPVARKEMDTEKPTANIEMDTERSGSGGKRKRGRIPKASPAKATASRKVEGDSVCFICLDGGDLVLCDRRGCPKAYHPSCVDHDEEFFKTKGRWNCGWHLCNNCAKSAHFLCYTCTFSLCKGCCKGADIFCVRGNKGFCESCMKTVKAIENGETTEMGQDFFKDYWVEQKGKLSITSDELAQAKNPWKDSDKHQASFEAHEGNNDAGADSDGSLGNLESNSSRKKVKRKPKSVNYETESSLEKETGSGKRKVKRRLKSQMKDANSGSEHSSQDTSNKRGKRAKKLSKSHSKANNGDTEWASNELLEFVKLMRHGDTSILTQFDVQSLLLEYIKRNKLRDPRRQSQILCDSMLQKLFGKTRVGHFEMLKLLELHFLVMDDPDADSNQASQVEAETSQMDADDNAEYSADAGRSKGRKPRKKGEEKGLQSDLDDYAAIDTHNINLIFLRRSLMEALLNDSERFHDKVVGTFVRIRIPGSSQKQDIYRLVQIIGTSKAAEPYKVGKRTTDIMIEILNLDKTEIISIDTISNQEFTEDECKRLRQSIKCGLISRMTVGDLLEKAKDLQEVRVTDWLEAEIVRLSHLRDRASDLGRKKELRECVEKLQRLKAPEERRRRLDEVPQVHSDPKMDPSYNSEDENEMDTSGQANDMVHKDSGSIRRGRDQLSSRKGGSFSSDSWSANARPPNKSELNRSSSGRGFTSRMDEPVYMSPTREPGWNNGVDKGTPSSNSWEKSRVTSDPLTSAQTEYSGMRSNPSPGSVSESPKVSVVVGQSDSKVNETEKIWHYKDPSGKVQGPFSIGQLRKWSNTGYFPADLRIWRTSQGEDDSLLLTEVLAGRFQKELTSVVKNVPPSIDNSKFSGNARGSETSGRYESSNMPSPTPTQTPFKLPYQSGGGNERLPSPTPTSPTDPSVGRSNFSKSKGGASINKGENVASPMGVMQPASGQFFSSSGRPAVSSNASGMGAQQAAAQSIAHVGNQQYAASNAVQPGNPPVYNQGWVSGYSARPETVNSSNLTPNLQNAAATQVAYGQWTGNPANNQAVTYGTGFPSGAGTASVNYQTVPSQNAWRPPPSNMPQWSMGWTGPPAGAAYGQVTGTTAGAMVQQAGSMPVAPAATGWSGVSQNPSAGSANAGWGNSPGNTGGRGGDLKRNGGGSHYQRQSQSSYGSGGQRVCKFYQETGHCRKGASCDYMHT